MRTFLLTLVSITVVSYAFYLRITLGSADMWAVISIPCLFYLLLVPHEVYKYYIKWMYQKRGDSK